MDVFVLDLRSRDVDGAVVPGKLTLPTPTLDTLQLATSVAFLVHGFNVSRPNGSAELQQLGHLLSSLGAGAAVCVLWPGDSRFGPLCYPFETNNAIDSGVELAKFIHDYLPQRPRLSFVAHSMGARVALQAVAQLRSMSIAVEQICLMAAAVDNDCLASSGEYGAAAQFASRTAVLYSPSDKVLRFAYPAGNLISAFLHWAATTDAALGYTGPRPAQGPTPSGVTATGIPSTDGVNHGDYVPNANPPPSQRQLAAASYANLVVGGAPGLFYRLQTGT